ncbi:putative ubiquitin carboxyl-terminal hydrolase [Echria macrotheca]|uniref:Ubiquitin carboxyl-terminal hydrolase n=1 Tax=Echria macrotheca TaxID=438768 RepID=A0AAJ0BCZ5_9PEZI|nr:putative ubiquitin carboxyl-terminal hydrolase [Echria macrotheca]
MLYQKHFTPIESNPALFTELAHALGLSGALQFHDVLSLDDAELLALIPRPTLALILVFPTPADYYAQLAEKDRGVVEYTGSGDEENVIWYKQTINNACGLYAILHAVSNGVVQDFIAADSHLRRLLDACASLKPTERASVLEGDEELESIYNEFALQGDSEVPANPEDEVDFHYVCFVKSQRSGHLYELDGDRKGPMDLGQLDPHDDMLSDKALDVVRRFVGQIKSSTGVGLLALAPSG